MSGTSTPNPLVWKAYRNYCNDECYQSGDWKYRVYPHPASDGHQWHSNCSVDVFTNPEDAEADCQKFHDTQRTA